MIHLTQGEWGIQRDNLAGRRQFERGMEGRARQETEGEDPQWKGLRQAWCWGEKTFRKELLDLIELERTEQHYGEELVESMEQEAQRLIAEMLNATGWSEKDLHRVWRLWRGRTGGSASDVVAYRFRYR